MPTNTIMQGILFMLSSSFCFALMNGFAKILSTDNIPSMEAVFFRSLVMVIFILFVYLYNFIKHKPYHRYKKGGWGKLFFRVIMGGFAMLFVFYNIATIPLGVATAFAQSVPLYAVIMGIIFLKEKVSFLNIIATIIGFLGILFISNPNFNGIQPVNILAGILSGLTMAFAFVTLRNLKEYFDNTFLIFAFGVSTTLLGFFGMFLPFHNVGGFVAPSFTDWIFILGMGISGTFAQYFLNKAYLNAPVGIVSPIDYFRIVFSMIIGIFLGDSLPNLMTSLGIILIIVSGLLIALPVLLYDLKRLNKKV